MTAPDLEDVLTVGLSVPSSVESEGLSTPALDRLNPQRREFVFHYVRGAPGIRGVAYKAYIAAGYTVKNNNVASAAAYQLLHDPTVEAAITEVQKDIDVQAKAQLKSWMVLAVKGQTLLEAYLDTLGGKPPESGPVLLGPNALQAIKDVLDRALGRPTQKVEKEIGERMDALIRELAAKRRSPYVRPTVDTPALIGTTKHDAIDADMVADSVSSESERESPPPGGTGMGRDLGGVGGPSTLTGERS